MLLGADTVHLFRSRCKVFGDVVALPERRQMKRIVIALLGLMVIAPGLSLAVAAPAQG